MAPRAPQSASSRGRDDVTARALAHVPGLAPGEAPESVEALPGGVANRCALVTTRAGRFVVRTHERPHVLGAGARRREALLQTLAASAGIAPRVVWASEEGDVLVTEYAAGRPWSARDMQDAAQLRRLCSVWRSLHALSPAVLEPFDGAATALRYRTLIAATDGEDARCLDAAAAEAAQLAQSIAAEGRAPTTIHGDPHHTNVVDDGTRVRLVDWEYAALADPLADAGCLLAYYPAARTFAPQILEWSGLASSADAAALDRVRRLYELLSKLWVRAVAEAPSGAQGAEWAD